jgi:Ser/Thr protein kinase RdoA (MazF antagonist)
VLANAGLKVGYWEAQATALGICQKQLWIHAAEQIIAQMEALGQSADVWGPIHGDLHYDNLVINAEGVHPIDFTGLYYGHYLYDLGVTVYHTFYQGGQLREALFAGYRELWQLPTGFRRTTEGFVIAAALANLAWNSTIPSQVASKLFQDNLHDLVHVFCTPFILGAPFLEDSA